MKYPLFNGGFVFVGLIDFGPALARFYTISEVKRIELKCPLENAMVALKWDSDACRGIGTTYFNGGLYQWNAMWQI
jgi:hypothetical protein